MQVALGLARRGLGNTHPNPAVGCVLVRPDMNNRVVGRGWTQSGGRPHAETVALQQAGDLADDATAYVTLEPCCHHGKTTPCSDALISAGVKRVVIALEDPDPRVSGQGAKALEDAGLHVTTDVCTLAAAKLNSGFMTRTLRGRPVFTLKIASTVDGKTASATGDSQWITGPDARMSGHAQRAAHDAILTGIGTVLSDDPMLTCRLPGCDDHSPVRVILDTKLSITPEHSMIRSASIDKPVWLFVSEEDAPPEKLSEIDHRDGVRVFTSPKQACGRLNVREVSRQLADAGINSVLIESGGEVAASFVGADLVDKIVWYRAPSLMGGEGKSAISALEVTTIDTAPRYECISARQVGEDMMETYVTTRDPWVRDRDTESK